MNATISGLTARHRAVPAPAAPPVYPHAPPESLTSDPARMAWFTAIACQEAAAMEASP